MHTSEREREYLFYRFTPTLLILCGFVTYFVIRLNHMCARGPFAGESLALQVGPFAWESVANHDVLL
jgi:hypothetical protein